MRIPPIDRADADGFGGAVGVTGRCGRARVRTVTARAAAPRAALLAGIVSLMLAAAAQAQGRLDADTLKHFGGTYRLDCADDASPKAVVRGDALLFEHGSRRVAGRNVQAAASFLGPNMPPSFRTVLLSEVGQQQMLFVLHEDRAGYYLTIDGDPKLMAAIGKPPANRRFRHCDGAARPAQAAPAPQARAALHEQGAAGLLQDPRAKAAYQRALGPLARERWLARLDGPSPQNRRIRAANTSFVLASACKPHDCAQNNTVLLYSAAGNVVYGKVYQRGRSTLIGAPPPAVTAELERLWRAEWRQGR